MATILSVPPELLLDIFEIASNPPYPPMVFYTRAVQLSRLSRVHSSYTDPARSLMVQDLRVKLSEGDGPERLEQIAAIFSSPPWNEFTTRSLTLDRKSSVQQPQPPPIKILDSPSELRPFDRLITVHLLGEGAIDLYILTSIKTLQTLWLYYMEISSSNEAGTTFPALRRLNLDTPLPESSALFPSIMKSSTIMPNLTSLALLFTYSCGQLSRYSKLRNLALTEWKEDTLDNLAGLELDVLHLSAHGVEPETAGPEALLAIVKGKHKTIKAEKVILYGEPGYVNGALSEEECGLFQWCDDVEELYSIFA